MLTTLFGIIMLLKFPYFCLSTYNTFHKNIVLFSREINNFIFHGQTKSIICDKT